ncbi:hypothetical protein ACEQ8H_001291 [Pleosporales sp. CAS-2024a]
MTPRLDALPPLVHSKPDFLYLRLFYAEQFHGWNKQFWKTYLWRSICVAAIPLISLVIIRIFQPHRKHPKTLTTLRAFVVLYAMLAALILLYFSLGRMTMLPITQGVHEMPRFGCCSQAFVFPNIKAQQLVEYFKGAWCSTWVGRVRRLRRGAALTRFGTLGLRDWIGGP